ncbi:MAG: O-antigen ligase family protein [Nitrospinaceae bacterium]
MTSKPEATITPKIPSTIPRIANATLTFCFILFTLAYAFSISLTQIAAYSGVAAWLIQTHLTHSWKKTKFILIWPIGLFFLAGVLSVVTAVDPELSLSGLKKLLKAIVFFWVMNALALIRPMDFLIYLSQQLKISKIRNFIEARARSLKNISPLSLLVGIMITTGALSAAYGIFQGLTQPKGVWIRNVVHGSLSNIMTYTVIIMLITSFVLARILFDPRASKKFLIGALVFLGGPMALTLLRQSWLGLFMAAIFLLFIKKRVLVLVPILLVGLILMFGPHTIAERLKSIVDLKQASNNERIMLWKAGWEVFKDYPLTGCGFKCLDVVADQYPEHPILQKYPHLHSNMQIAVETGAIGLCAWISIWIVYFVQLTRRSRQIPPDANERWVIFGSAAAVIAFLVAGMFENNFYDSEIIILMYFIMALPFVDSNNAKSAPSNPTSSSIPR